MDLEIIAYGGWQRCARLAVGETEMVVTLEVGPRILRYGLVGGPNELFENPGDRGLTGGDTWRSYGGHRLWIGPEDRQRTMQPDNEPVEHERDGEGWVFRARPDRHGIQKLVRVTADASRQRFAIDHTLVNHGAYAVELTAWALTVMAPGGECLFPQEPFVQQLLPVRPLVLWGYTRMADPRWTWGDRVVRLRQRAEVHGRQAPPQKVGMRVTQGVAAYANHGNVFVKRFPYVTGAPYSDFGCNFETYTNHEMLEVESVGPLERVQPGGGVHHREAWYLLANQTPPGSDDACADWLATLASERPLG